MGGNKTGGEDARKTGDFFSHAGAVEISAKCWSLSEKLDLSDTRQVTRATHVRNRVCPRVELILKIRIILLIIFLGFI